MRVSRIRFFPACPPGRVARIAIVALPFGGVSGAACGGWMSATARTPRPKAALSTREGNEVATRTPARMVTATPAPAVVIETPVDGQITLDRTAVVSGHAPPAPRGGATLTSVLVNGREFDVAGERGGGFTVPVTLALGANTLVATSELDVPGGGERNLKSASVVLTRKPGPTTGELDRATALWVAEDSSAVYWLCGEADACLAEPYCVRVSATRVDCPAKSRFQPGDPVRCGVVVAVHVQGPRLYSYAYPCKGRWRDPGAFVQPAIVRTGRRYHVDEDEADWLVYEINERNRYGIPRFDVKRDEFLP
jgi:hypothetical protein